MKIIIVGGGFTGIQLAKNLIAEKNIVTLIDNDEDVARHASNGLDCTVVQADGNKLETLEDAGIAKADALVCTTESDEVNMITCSLVDAVYPNVLKIARVRNYSYYVNKTSAQKTHMDYFSGNHRPLYGIDFMIHPDVEAAEAIVQAVQNGAVSDVLAFEGTDLQLMRMTISETSVLCGKQLKDVRSLISCPFLIAYVESANGENASLPFGNTTLEAGCSVGMLARREDTKALLELCGSQQKEVKRIALVGAGKIGSIVAERLIEVREQSFISKLFDGRFNRVTKNAQQFAIIDNDEKLAKAAAENFPTARVYRADGTDEAFLREEDIVSYDLVICVTNNREMNMVMAAYLESLGVGQSISLVANAAFATIARKLGVDVAIPIRDVVVDSIMSHLRGDTVKEVHTLGTGNMEIIECALPAESEVIGKTLKEISNPGVYLVLMVKPNGSDTYEIPVGDTKLSPGDHVVIITDAEQASKTVGFFGA